MALGRLMPLGYLACAVDGCGATASNPGEVGPHTVYPVLPAGWTLVVQAFKTGEVAAHYCPRCSPAVTTPLRLHTPSSGE